MGETLAMEADIVVAGLEDQEEQRCGRQHRVANGVGSATPRHAPVTGPPR